MFRTEQLLRKIYYNAKTGYQSADELYEKAKEIEPSVRKKGFRISSGARGISTSQRGTSQKGIFTNFCGTSWRTNTN